MSSVGNEEEDMAAYKALVLLEFGVRALSTYRNAYEAFHNVHLPLLVTRR